MKLWVVRVEFDMVVQADSKKAAMKIAVADAVGELDNNSPKLVADRFKLVREIATLEDIPEDWKDATPWGGDFDDESTCQDIMRDKLLPVSGFVVEFLDGVMSTTPGSWRRASDRVHGDKTGALREMYSLEEQVGLNYEGIRVRYKEAGSK